MNVSTTATRWCPSCNREHGRSFICSSYSADTVARIKLEESAAVSFASPSPLSLPLLAFGAPGNGTNDLLAPFSQAR